MLNQKTSGFTLIELLVGMILAALVITPLMGFMINIIDTDRREQAKATSEQELQAALDYISRDLEQAVYIYDADGLTRDNSATPADSGIRNQIPPIAPANGCSDASKCQPVVVFWKREYKKNVVPVSTTSNCALSPSSCDDTFVYSLVGYYLIKDDNDTWSKTARIGRFQIEDGVKAPTANGTGYVTGSEPSAGFNLFNLNLQGDSLKAKMNQWKKKDGESYTDQTVVLLDYIDHSTVGVPQVSCPTGMQEVPPYTGSSAVIDTFKTYSFYACVDSSKTMAQVHLRGNALARFREGVTYSTSDSAYFPEASIQVKGRGLN